ncbi:hypothetical protein G7Z17_g12 [Cylindrodendrum hubeiense]|uniref:PA14 domain-containing protein n=1 Tax=Cylindrodendrum hubeiense TaxID=595255 RepID=A0A9P5HHJ2_9HYPO|nr:hypothetical protein G7Z17_g12 [Cylindrodendrum hubeiense]
MRQELSLLAFLPLAVFAAPNACPDKQFCRLNSAVVDGLRQDDAATPFCANYLGLSTTTVTTTVTPDASKVYNTEILTVTGDAITSIETDVQHTTQTQTVIETNTQTVSITITSTTSTSWIGCLNGAYTASEPVGTLRRRNNEDPRPTAIPDDWNSYKVSRACSCLNVPSPTSTVTATDFPTPTTVVVTATDTVIPVVQLTETDILVSTSLTTSTVTTTSTTTLTAHAVATSIVTSGNGLAYRKYTHTYNARNTDSANSFTSTFFKGMTPDFRGNLKSLTFSTAGWPSGTSILTLSDGQSFNAGQAAMLFNGFFVARETGYYTFSSSGSYIDNWGYLWTGDKAYRDWNDGNADFKASRIAEPYVSGSVRIWMNKGDAIPLTWLWVNGGTKGQSYFAITTPSGSTTTDASGYFASYCSSSLFV